MSPAPQLSPHEAARIVDVFLGKVSRLNLKNYDSDVRLIKGWASEAREELRGVDVERPDLDPRTLAVMKELAAGRQEDERIVGLALMAHHAARTGGNPAAQAALFVYLSGPSGYALAHDSDAVWERLPEDVRKAIADWTDNLFGDDETRRAVRDAVLSVKTERIAGLVAYVVSGRMEGDVAHWREMASTPGQSRPSLAEYIRGAIGFACADAVMKADQRIVAGVRRVSMEVSPGSSSGNDRIAARNRPDRLVITPDGHGGTERLTMALAFSGDDSSGQFFEDYMVVMDAVTRPDSGTPFAGVPASLVYINTGNFVASGQTSGAGVKFSSALAGATLEEKQDLAAVPLLSTPWQWESKKIFLDFFRFNPLVLGSSTLRWYHFVERLADGRMGEAEKRREALLWTFERFAKGLCAIERAISRADYAKGGIQGQVNSTLKKSALLLDKVACLGGDVLTQEDYDKTVKPMAKQVHGLTSGLLESTAGRNASILRNAFVAAQNHLKESSFADFKEKHDSYPHEKDYKTVVTSVAIQPGSLEWFHPVAHQNADLARKDTSYFGIADAQARKRLLRRKEGIRHLLDKYTPKGRDAPEKAVARYRQVVERVAATLASDDLWNEVVRNNPGPWTIANHGFCEMSPEEQADNWLELRATDNSRLKSHTIHGRLSDQQRLLLQTRQEDIHAILRARQADSIVKPNAQEWVSETARLTRAAGLASPVLWQLLVPNPDGTKSPITSSAITKRHPGLLESSPSEQRLWLENWAHKSQGVRPAMKKRALAVLEQQDCGPPATTARSDKRAP